MEPISIERLSHCHSLLQQKIVALDNQLLEQRIRIRVVQALRTYAEQEALYAQGRTTPGDIVTWAHGGYSMHNFGFAVDCMPSTIFDGPWTMDENPYSDGYMAMTAIALSLGLASGARWTTARKDYPHLQLMGLPITPTDRMRADLTQGGIPLVWENYDKGEYVP